MAKFVTQFGSYTLVLKPKGGKPIYDHTGKPVRVEGTIFIEFKHLPGTAVGVYETDDPGVIESLKSHPNYNKAFRELLNEADIKKLQTVTPAAIPIKLPKSALMACNKNELLSMTKQYKIIMGDECSKAEIIEAIMKAQESGTIPTPESIQPTQENQSSIKRIVQDPNAQSAG